MALLLDPVIEIEGVTKRYREVRALDDVSCRIESGVTGLLGPNGSGKSTLIKALFTPNFNLCFQID